MRPPGFNALSQLGGRGLRALTLIQVGGIERGICAVAVDHLDMESGQMFVAANGRPVRVRAIPTTRARTRPKWDPRVLVSGSR